MAPPPHAAAASSTTGTCFFVCLSWIDQVPNPSLPPAISPTIHKINLPPSDDRPIAAVPDLGTQTRGDFPALEQDAYPGKPLVYLDSAATSQKPRAVLDAMQQYYELSNANVHRGAHALSIRATEAYEAARDKVQVRVFWEGSLFLGGGGGDGGWLLITTPFFLVR